MQQSSSHALKPLLFRGVVWALDSFLDNNTTHIAAGFGSWLYIYREQSPGKWKLVLKSQPFRDRDKIIEIRHYSHSRLLLVASDRFKLFALQDNKLNLLLSKENLSDFILDVAIHEAKESYTLAYGHNFIEEYKDTVLHKTVSCEDNSVIFCIRLSPFNSYVAAGTVFSEILLWNTASESQTAKVEVRVKGHLGVIFRVTWISAEQLVSVSDDRSVRMWRLQYINNAYTGKYEEIWMKFGHSARVWDALFIQGPHSAIVATVSEDASCKTWNAATGQQIDHFRGHQGKNVWRVTGYASDKLATIITGGEDGSLKVWRSRFPLQEEEKVEESVITHSFPMPDDATLAEATKSLKNFKPLVKGVALAGDQKLYCCTNYGAVYELVYTKEEISAKLVYHDSHFQNFTEFILLDDKALLSHANGDCSLISLVSHELLQQWKCEAIRITNLYFLAQNLLLSTTGIGAFSLWKYNSQICRFELFCRCELPLKSSVLGAWFHPDSSLLFCGSKTGKVYCFEPKITDSTEPLTPTNQIALHKDRLHGFYGKEQESTVVTFAKDSQVKHHKIDNINKTLHTLSSIKVPLVNLIHQVFPTSEGYYVYGFDGAKLVLTNTSTCQQIFSVKCGGGHRPNEARVLSQNEFYIAYSKSNTVTIHFKQNKESVEAYSITPSFHGREVLAACFYTIQNKKYLLTAAQDTLLQLHFVNEQSGLLEQIQVLNFHIGSVRCVEKVQSGEDTFILTGGGRMILNLFVVNRVSKTLEHIQKFTLREGQDYRIMTIAGSIEEASVEEEVKEKEKKSMLVFIGTTSGQVMCMRYSFKLRKMDQIWDYQYGSTVLKVKMLSITTTDCILFAGLNNGFAVVHHLNVEDFTYKMHKFQVHQMGLNGLEVINQSSQKAIILSAADDQTVSMTSFSFVTHEFLKVNSVDLAHHSAIKDLSISGNRMVTCGYDQRLKLWKIEESEIKLVDELYTCVGDMNASAMTEGMVCLCGQGIEILQYS